MSHQINPFQVLYVTDSPDPKVFVQLFSDYPVRFSHPVFQAGNVVLKGTQGSGKSMLLNLLRPQIRLAYAKAGFPFPLPESMQHFVSAGINLTLSGALDIGQRPLSRAGDDEDSLFPLFFADFINYFVVRDLLKTLDLMATNPGVFGATVSKVYLNAFVRELAIDDCWFGYLQTVSTFDDLSRQIDRRLAAYRSFHQFNADLPADIQATKTNIGDPIARAERALKETKVIPESVPLFIRIDQLERLYRSDVLRPSLGRQYRRVVNKALGKRDSRVSYRIGTRRYAWEDDLVIFGSDDKLEHLRDFRVVDIDDKMRRKEDRKTWLFPEFAADAFDRRVKLAGYTTGSATESLRAAFGGDPPPEDAARQYAKDADANSVLRIDDEWPSDWREFLFKEFESDPFSATLAAAWARQQGGRSGHIDRRMSAPPTDAPWKRQYWRKERVRQCLMQIAARNRQRLRWTGRDAILSLSAPNISVFLSVCHEVFDAFLRSEQRKPEDERIDPLRDGIHPDIQTVGIQTASQEWYEKIAEQPHGHDRLRFVDLLGRSFRKWLLDDEAMSNPGHNGFSLEVEQLREYPDIQRFLQDAADFGDLYDSDHTTKNTDRKQRKKWYLNPILSAFFQVPEAHPKEPRYISISEVMDWLTEARIELPSLRGRQVAGRSQLRGGASSRTEDPNQGRLPFDVDESESEQ